MDLLIFSAYFLNKLVFFFLLRLGMYEVWLAYFKRIHLCRLNHQERLINLHLSQFAQLFEDNVA